MPPEIGRLNKLKRLTLWGWFCSAEESVENEPEDVHKKCGLTTLPEEIGKLESLESLELNSTSLAELPKEIGLLKSLKSLDISNNKIERLPNSISNLNNIRYIDVTNNPIVNNEEEISKLENIEGLETIYI